MEQFSSDDDIFALVEAIIAFPDSNSQPEKPPLYNTAQLQPSRVIEDTPTSIMAEQFSDMAIKQTKISHEPYPAPFLSKTQVKVAPSPQMEKLNVPGLVMKALPSGILAEEANHVHEMATMDPEITLSPTELGKKPACDRAMSAPHVAPLPYTMQTSVPGPQQVQWCWMSSLTVSSTASTLPHISSPTHCKSLL